MCFFSLLVYSLFLRMVWVFRYLKPESCMWMLISNSIHSSLFAHVLKNEMVQMLEGSITAYREKLSSKALKYGSYSFYTANTP